MINGNTTIAKKLQRKFGNTEDSLYIYAITSGSLFGNLSHLCYLWILNNNDAEAADPA